MVKYKTIWIKIKGLKTELNALSVYDDKYIKTKIGTYSDKAYTHSLGLNEPEDGECKSFSHFHWFITCIWQQILFASISR